MSEIYSSMGAVYSPMELEKEFRRLELQQKEILCAKEEQDSVETDLTAVFARLYTNRGIECGEQLAKMTAVTFRTLSRQKLMVYDGVKETLAELKQRGKDENSDILGAGNVGMDTLYLQTETSPRIKGTSSATYCVPDGDWGKVSEILLRLTQ